jgi:hypothetical protein
VIRTIAGKQLLDQKPMSLREFAAGLGIPSKLAYSTMQNLLAAQLAERTSVRGQRGYIYRRAA